MGMPLTVLRQLQAANMLLENNLPKELAHLNKGLPLHTDTGAPLCQASC